MQQPSSLHMDDPGTLLKMAGYFLWDRRTERFSREQARTIQLQDRRETERKRKKRELLMI